MKLILIPAGIGCNYWTNELFNKQFKEVCDLDGIILTKLDGTAKGGVVIAIQELNIPVYFIGVGEGIDDFGV